MTWVMLIQLLVIYLILPAAFIYSLWKASFQSKVEWLVQLLTTAMLIIWLVLSGPWDWFGYYVRYLWLVLLMIAVWKSLKKARSLPFQRALVRRRKWSVAIYALLLIVFGLYNSFVLSSYFVEGEALELSFPLQEGTYYVAQGGNHVQMNYHQDYESQKYALDIVKLNGLGMRANGFYPQDLEKYAVYGVPLYSPCHGEVVETRDGLADLIPPEMDGTHPEGNYVALRCDHAEPVIYLAHMQQNSLVVEEGMTVREGDILGRVGNSGNTTEPHLHIHAEQNGKGIPLRFNGRFLVRNSLVRSCDQCG